MKSPVFKVSLVDLYTIFIPKEIFLPFATKKMGRVQVIVTVKNISINFYAAVKKDKNSGDYKMMFSKAKQKELDLAQGDTFKMQLFEDKTKYGVEMPEELEEVFLTDVEAFKIFETLTPGKQRSIIYGVLRFKSSQQKIDKAFIMCENLKRRNFDTLRIFKL